MPCDKILIEIPACNAALRLWVDLDLKVIHGPGSNVKADALSIPGICISARCAVGADRAKRCPFGLLLKHHCPLPQPLGPAAVQHHASPPACTQPSSPREAAGGQHNSPEDVIMTQAPGMGYSAPFALSPADGQVAEDSTPAASLGRLRLSLGSDDQDAAPSSPLPDPATGALPHMDDAMVRPHMQGSAQHGVSSIMCAPMALRWQCFPPDCERAS